MLDTALKDLTPEEIRQLGLEGDTKNDTVRTLIGAAKESNRRYEKVISQNEKILKENETLRKREQDVQQQVDEAVQSKTRELQNMVAILREEMSQLVQGRTSSNESTTYQGNTTNEIGVEEDTPLPIGNGQGGTGTAENGQRVEWVNPDDQIEDERNPAKIGFPNLNVSNTTSGKRDYLLFQAVMRMTVAQPLQVHRVGNKKIKLRFTRS